MHFKTNFVSISTFFYRYPWARGSRMKTRERIGLSSNLFDKTARDQLEQENINIITSNPSF